MESISLRDAILEQISKDEEHCLNLTKEVIFAIENTKVNKDIKTSIQKQFYKYFSEAKKLYFRAHQIDIITNARKNNINECHIDNILLEVFFYVNIPMNYCERKAQKLADLLRRVAIATSYKNQKDLTKLKMMIYRFFSTIKIDVDLDKEEEEEIIESALQESNRNFSNFINFTKKPEQC